MFWMTDVNFGSHIVFIFLHTMNDIHSTIEHSIWVSVKGKKGDKNHSR